MGNGEMGCDDAACAHTVDRGRVVELSGMRRLFVIKQGRGSEVTEAVCCL